SPGGEGKYWRRAIRSTHRLGIGNKQCRPVLPSQPDRQAHIPAFLGHFWSEVVNVPWREAKTRVWRVRCSAQRRQAQELLQRLAKSVDIGAEFPAITHVTEFSLKDIVQAVQLVRHIARQRPFSSFFQDSKLFFGELRPGWGKLLKSGQRVFHCLG